MKTLLPFAALILCLTDAHAYDEHIVIDRWKPIVTFAGNGHPTLAIDKLRGINEIQSLMVDHSTFDPQSQRFINELWGSIEDFNLQRFYQILPEQKGEWRELQVQGRREGGKYCYVEASQKTFDAKEHVNRLGDTSLLVRSRQIHLPEKSRTHYLMGADWHIGLGAYSWQSLRATVTESVGILSKPDAAPPKDTAETGRIKRRVQQMSPHLGDEDIAIIAPLWAAFPHLWEQYSQLGRVDNVLVDKSASIYGLNPATDTIKDVDIIISLDPDKIERLYPAIAAYINRVDDLLAVNLELFVPEGRVLKIGLDTTGLTLRISMLVNGEGLVPVENDRPRSEKTLYFRDQEITMMAVVDTTVDMLGITTNIHDIRSTLNYRPFGEGLRIDLNMNTLPTVAVKGNAFGVIPTGLINAMIPANIDTIILEFMKVAVQGNDGKGIEASVNLQNTHSFGVTHLALSGQIEALDSLLARIGVAIVNTRMIPSEAQGKELIALAKTSRQAFDQDLARYEKIIADPMLTSGGGQYNTSPSTTSSDGQLKARLQAQLP